ncbi:hypothetical protein evm_004924 [Chilo suppressalis]|nr:hypothetical protein evm_004924 [Chilo suppressalis]
MDQTLEGYNVRGYDPSVVRQTSMGTLIMWNISKVVKKNPLLDLQSAIRATQERLCSNARGSNVNVSQEPEDQYLMCAILAWQQLGHNGTDSLYSFIESKRKDIELVDKPKLEDDENALANKINKRLSPGSFISYNSPSISNNDSTYHDAVGPVLKLPVETKIIMRMDTCNHCAPKPKKKPEQPLMDKIDAICCMDSACLERLSKLDKETAELRTRAQRLARREAQRVELLERAEAAWKDLEMGYQRRLASAEEKEEDMTKHIQKMIQERNGFKTACMTLAKQLKGMGDAAEKERELLTNLEKEICDSACERLRLSEEAARVDAQLAELQCKSAQLDRDLQFKEEQVRGRLQTMENEVDCARALTYEAERTIHAELGALRDQITTVSTRLLEEDERNGLIKEELEQLRREKMEIIEDLEGCQALCNKGTQNKMDELNKKREQLRELKEKVMECQCKLPVDAEVEVKRTPSLVALCKCMPEEKFSESCSCSSLRTTLLTNLLSDLFGGLQSELGGCCAQMPCQLLKCLEDKHNWDKASVIKTNLQNYFSKLLVGELDIAIATSIEKYHAKWVGASCADTLRQVANRCRADVDSNPDRVIEKRAQKLAEKLADQILKERADLLTAKAKEVMKAGPPPCECSNRSGSGNPTAVYPCFVKQPTIGGAQSNASGTSTPAYWRRTHHNVAQLRLQLEDLKKVSIKKEDLKIMEDKIVKMVQRSIPEPQTEDNCIKEVQKTSLIKNHNISRASYTDQVTKRSPATKLNCLKNKQSDLMYPKQAKKNTLLGIQLGKPVKPLKKLGQSYAVNLCLCGTQKETKRNFRPEFKGIDNMKDHESAKPFKGLVINDILPQSSNINQAKPIVKNMQSEAVNNEEKVKIDHSYCRSDIACFHKLPSNTSVDNLLNTLARWKCDLFKINSKTDNHKATMSSIDEKCIYEEIINNVSKEKSKQDNSTMIIKNISVKTLVNQCNPTYTQQLVQKVSRAVDLQSDLPMNTNSEYIGAVNLEKSNENFCKCVIDTENTPKFPYECTKFAKCDCENEKCTYKLSSKDFTENIILVPENKLLSLTAKPKMHMDEINSKSKSNNVDFINPKENVIDEDLNPISNPSTLLTGDSEYCITFLGVTLTNNKSRKDVVGKESTCFNIYHTPALKHDTADKKLRNVDKPVTDFCDEFHNKFDKALSSQQTQMGSCECSIKYEELKSFVDNALSKQRGDYCKNEDKALDTNSLRNSKPESCICCKRDESKDLEVNTFHLLEEHLRDKLDEFKSTTCESECISSSDQDKLFATILQRVKQVISDSTLNIACKCVSGGPTGGSWHRAYVLLQEYLKLKIKKVQCLCQTPEDNKHIEVLERVCNLIENDFERLKDICKCKSNRKRSRKSSKEMPQVEVPEKDTNGDLFYLNKCYDKGTSNKSMMPYRTTESQVSSNLGMHTRSCITNKQILEDRYTISCSDSNFQKSSGSNKDMDESHIEFEIKENVNDPCKKKSYQTLYHSHFPANAYRPIQTERSDKKENLDYSVFFCNTHVPYIGYTVDCSCNRTFGPCSCSKAIVLKNTDNIKNIWTTLTSKSYQHKDNSYIMNAVPKHSKEIDGIELINTNDFKKIPEKELCDEKISVHHNEEITLKVSKGNLSKTYIPNTTTSKSVDNVSLGTDWSDCISTKTKSQRATDISAMISDSLYHPIHNLMNCNTTESKEKYDPNNLSRPLSSKCDCNMVPMCHVKMLVENIEKKLMHSKCTCDSLCAKVCPEHSKRNI